MAKVEHSLNEWFNSGGGNGQGSFEEHAERMRRFRKSHAHIPETPKPGKPPRLESTPALYAPHTTGGTGGSTGLINVADWLHLIPMRPAPFHRFSQN